MVPTIFVQCIEMLGANCFTIGQYNTLVTIFKVRLQTSFLRVKDRMEKRKEEDYDEELEEDLNEEDKIDEQYLKKVLIVHFQCACQCTEMVVILISSNRLQILCMHSLRLTKHTFCPSSTSWFQCSPPCL